MCSTPWIRTSSAISPFRWQSDQTGGAPTGARLRPTRVADKEESQEICFVGKGSYADFVAKRRPDVTRPGEIVTTDGETIGQRRGAGASHHRPAQGDRRSPARASLCAAARSGRTGSSVRLSLRGGSLPSDRRRRRPHHGAWPEAADPDRGIGAVWGRPCPPRSHLGTNRRSLRSSNSISIGLLPLQDRPLSSMMATMFSVAVRLRQSSAPGKGRRPWRRASALLRGRTVWGIGID